MSKANGKFNHKVRGWRNREVSHNIFRKGVQDQGQDQGTSTEGPLEPYGVTAYVMAQSGHDRVDISC